MVMLPETLGPEHFVRTFVTYLAAAAVTLHMLLGCCLHHAHETASACCNAAARDGRDASAESEAAHHEHDDGDCPQHGDDVARVDDAEHHDFDHEDGDQQDGDHNKPDSRQESCGEKCSFVAASRVSIELDGAVVALGGFASAEIAATESELVVRRREAWSAAAPPPIRLHLLHQLLLI